MNTQTKKVLIGAFSMFATLAAGTYLVGANFITGLLWGVALGATIMAFGQAQGERA